MSHVTMLDESTTYTANDVYPYGKKYAYYVLILLSMLMCFDFIDRMIVSSLFGDLNKELGVTPAQFGLLTGIVNIAIAVMAFPASLLVDRWSRKKSVGLMALIWGVSCLLCAFTGHFWQLFVLRFMVGAGEAGYGPGSTTILQGYFPTNKLNGALGILQSAGPAGVVLGMILGGIISQHFGWRHAFGVVAIPGLIITFLVFFIKEPVRTAAVKVNQDTGKEEKVSLTQIMLKILKTRTLMCIYLAMAMTLIFSACVAVWVPSFFRYTEGLGAQAAGFKGAGVMLAGALGAITGGMLADRLSRKNPSYPLKLAAFNMFMTCIMFSTAFLFAPQSIRYYFMLVGGFFLNSILGITYSSIVQAAPKAVRATAVGCCIVVQNIFGMAIGASISGVVAQHFGNVFKESPAFAAAAAQGADVATAATLAYGIQHAMLIMSFTTVIAGILFFIASTSYASDCDGAECF